MSLSRFDPSLCRQCGGRCCQGHPGVWSEPRRFFAIFCHGSIPAAAELALLLRDHRLALRDLGDVLVPAPLSTTRGCVALGPDGCAFAPDVRPCQCLALQPNLDTLLDDQIHCSLPPGQGSGTARANWRPYQELLGRARALLHRP